MQVDGYSLDAQRDKLLKYAEYQDMEVVKELSFMTSNRVLENRLLGIKGITHKELGYFSQRRRYGSPTMGPNTFHASRRRH